MSDDKYTSYAPVSVKLDVIKEELSNVQKSAGYMASADVVRRFLEKRIFQLEREVRLAEIQANAYSSNKDYPGEDSGVEYFGEEDIGAHDG
tara:strand:- start:146 stop:418 length:273 start_codon:yes stop_codon:yes gene_type:complete